MQVWWSNAALCFRAENKTEAGCLTQIARMLEGGKFVFYPKSPRSTYTDNEESISDID